MASSREAPIFRNRPGQRRRGRASRGRRGGKEEVKVIGRLQLDCPCRRRTGRGHGLMYGTAKRSAARGLVDMGLSSSGHMTRPRTRPNLVDASALGGPTCHRPDHTLYFVPLHSLMAGVRDAVFAFLAGPCVADNLELEGWTAAKHLVFYTLPVSDCQVV